MRATHYINPRNMSENALRSEIKELEKSIEIGEATAIDAERLLELRRALRQIEQVRVGWKRCDHL